MKQFFLACCGGNSLQLVSSKGDSGHHFSSAKKGKWDAKEKEGRKKDYDSEVLSQGHENRNTLFLPLVL